MGPDPNYQLLIQLLQWAGGTIAFLVAGGVWIGKKLWDYLAESVKDNSDLVDECLQRITKLESTVERHDRFIEDELDGQRRTSPS